MITLEFVLTGTQMQDVPSCHIYRSLILFPTHDSHYCDESIVPISSKVSNAFVHLQYRQIIVAFHYPFLVTYPSFLFPG